METGINKQQDQGYEIGENNRLANKFLTFVLAEETYGVPLSAVKEIIGMTEITDVPKVPDFFKGLINLRGKIISVVDLRLKLSLPEGEYIPKQTSIIIAELDDVVIGAIVDRVSEVIGYEKGAIDQDTGSKHRVNKTYVTGIAKGKGDKLIVLLDIGRILSTEDLRVLRQEPR